MSEFEIATVAFQEASLALAWVSSIGGGISALAAVIAATGIWCGIAAMNRSNKDRARALDQQRLADDQRHAEAMTAHRETMAANKRRHEEAMAAHKETMAAHGEAVAANERRHEESMAALKELIRRTSGPSAPAD